MKWENLQINKCPECGSDLETLDAFIWCDCSFAITHEDFSKIKDGYVEERDLTIREIQIAEIEINQHALNLL